MYIWGDCFITRALLLTHACTAVFLINSAGIEHCFLDEFQCQSLKEQTSNRQNYTYCSHAQKLLSCMQKEDDPILTPRVSNGDRCCASGYANSKIGLHIWTLGQDPDLWCWSQLRTKNEHFTKALKESQKKGKTRINRFHSPVSCQGFLFGPLIAINFKTGLYVRYDTLLMASKQTFHSSRNPLSWMSFWIILIVVPIGVEAAVDRTVWLKESQRKVRDDWEEDVFIFHHLWLVLLFCLRLTCLPLPVPLCSS